MLSLKKKKKKNLLAQFSALSLGAAFLSVFSEHHTRTLHTIYTPVPLCLEWDLKEAKQTQRMFLNRPGNSRRWKWPRFLTGKTTATTTITTATQLELTSETHQIDWEPLPLQGSLPVVIQYISHTTVLWEAMSSLAIDASLHVIFLNCLYLHRDERLCQENDTQTLSSLHIFF